MATTYQHQRRTLSPQRRPMATLRRNPASPFRHVDLVLLGCIATVNVIGALMVYSSTRGPTRPYDLSFLKKEIMFLIIGNLVMAGVAAVDYRRIRDFAPFIYGGTLLLLIGVLVPGIGSRAKGTQGWYQVGQFQLQPSEMAKLGLIIGFAAVAAQFRGDIDPRRLGVLLGVAGIPMALVMLQPDLGTTLVSAAVTFALLLVAGIKPRYIGVIALIGALGTAGVLSSGVLAQYQKDRLTTFVAQDSPTTQKHARNDAYNLEQAKRTIGSGGIAGKGVFNGPQTRLGNVPEQHTDFIFTAVGEELGFIGSATLLALLATIVWRVWRAAQLARDEFGTLVCAGIMAMFVFQIFENVGMTMGIMPITGIPLPFVSYGGSSTITSFVCMGLVLSIHMRRFS
ncbi:MAG: Rod shape-determining protein RodA [Acidimicrobiales bacterium]|nr:Rod shape-determining protein RodA [Acidimicrobiales bacterium]